MLQLFKKPMLQETLAQWLQSWVFLASVVLTLMSNTLLLGQDGRLGEKDLTTILPLQILQMINRRETYFFVLQDRTLSTEIFKTLNKPGEERTFKSASDVLDGYFLPKKNVVYE